MARPATGTVIERRNAAGRIDRTLRFPVNGRKRRVPLGEVTREVAEDRLAVELAKVRDGTWMAPAPPEPVREATPTFHEFADEWWALTESQLSENTRADYRWRLESHLLGYFGAMTLDSIKVPTVERYIAGKLAGAVYKDGREVRRQAPPLSPRSINMTLILLGAIIDRAVKHELIPPGNAAHGCRAKERTPTRSYLDSAAQISALLDAAGELDAKAPKDRRHVARRPMLAVLVFAGLRISEMLALRWRDVDLAGGWLSVADAKTDAGVRKVKIRGALRDELLAWRAGRQDVAQGAYVFATRTGRRLGADNFRNRVLGHPVRTVKGRELPAAGAIGQTNRNLDAAGLPPLPANLTPHGLRRTFCSLLYALGETPPVVMQEMGHTDPALALKVYAQAMRRGEHERAQLRELVEGFGPPMDRNGDLSGAEQVEQRAA
jgi:integrase